MNPVKPQSGEHVQYVHSTRNLAREFRDTTRSENPNSELDSIKKIYEAVKSSLEIDPTLLSYVDIIKTLTRSDSEVTIEDVAELFSDTAKERGALIGQFAAEEHIQRSLAKHFFSEVDKIPDIDRRMLMISYAHDQLRYIEYNLADTIRRRDRIQSSLDPMSRQEGAGQTPEERRLKYYTEGIPIITKRIDLLHSLLDKLEARADQSPPPEPIPIT